MSYAGQNSQVVSLTTQRGLQSYQRPGPHTSQGLSSGLLRPNTQGWARRAVFPLDRVPRPSGPLLSQPCACFPGSEFPPGPQDQEALSCGSGCAPRWWTHSPTWSSLNPVAHTLGQRFRHLGTVTQLLLQALSPPQRTAGRADGTKALTMARSFC